MAAIVAYLPALDGGFVLDDDILLTNSKLVQASDGLYRFWFTTEPRDYWPVTNSSFWIEWRLWGTNPAGYHATNLVLHIASALLIWAILSRLSIPGAWLAALLFAVHPVNVQSVAWIAQRKNALSMLFFLLSILSYLKADAERPLSKPDRPLAGFSRWYWLSVAAFVLAMLSKGSVAIGPVVLLMLAWWQRGRVGAGDIVRTAPLFVVAAVLTLVNIWFQTHGAEPSARTAPILERMLGAGAVIWFYLSKALMPLNLVFIYPQWKIETTNFLWWLPLLAAVTVTAVLVWQRDSWLGRPLLFAWTFFCVALLPVMGFANVGFMRYSLVSDHYLHIAIIGVVALVAAGFQLWERRARIVAPVAAVVVAGALGVLTFRQCRLYEDPVTLYEATLAKNPGSWLIHSNLGSVFLEQGRGAKAIEHFAQSVRLNPDYAKGHYNLGLALAGQGRTREAIDHYREAIRLANDAEAHNNLGNILAGQGQIDVAIGHFEQAVQLQPDLVTGRNNLAMALRLTGRISEAIEQYERSLESDPKSSSTHNNLANTLAQSGQLARAIEHYEQAVRMEPGFAEAHQNMATILERLQRQSDAIEHYQQAAAAYARAGRRTDAIAQQQRALDLARASGEAELTGQIEQQLQSYRAGDVLRSRRNANH